MLANLKNMSAIKIGSTYTHEVCFSQEQVNAFADVTGDHNPIHIDAEYATKTPFGRCIVHGFLAGSVFSKVFGTLFPGEGTIYMSQEMRFMAPVFPDTEYRAVFEVEETIPEKHRGVVACRLERISDGQICIEGKARILHREKL